jgi:hypothetical protein
MAKFPELKDKTMPSDYEDVEFDKIQHHAPSVGSITKRILEINPDLNTMQVVGLVRQAIKPIGIAGEFSSAEMIDEELALRLARATVKSG